MDIEKLLTNCYTPYSGGTSIAVAQSREGHCYPGVRVENIAYPLTISAVQSAIASCLSEGDQPGTLFVAGDEDTQLSFWQREFNIRVERLDGDNYSKFVFENLVLPPSLEIEAFLQKQLEKAVTIQSDFPVSAALKTDMGIFSGVNIEYSSWNMGICAERVAIAKAVSSGAREFLSLHIHARDGEFSSPCGACRQVILEHLPKGRVHLYHADLSKSSYYTRDLLPYSFHSTTLKKRTN